MINLINLAGEFYEEYCKAVGGIAFNGDPLPSWQEFSNDANKVKQKDGWLAVAKLAASKY